jgi:hypothetical protein
MSARLRFQEAHHLLADVGRPVLSRPRPPRHWPAMMSPEQASFWICRMPSCAAWHGFEAAKWRRTAARLRNRPWLDSLPVEVQWAHTKRVTRPSPSVPWTAGTEAMTAAASKSICPTDIIAYRANCTVFAGMHERPRVLLLSVLRCTLPLPRTLLHLP